MASSSSASPGGAASPSYTAPELSAQEMLKASLYDVLGVPKTASQDEIKKGYRKMALKYRALT
jgi:DnaJ-domain-containing protein 1